MKHIKPDVFYEYYILQLCGNADWDNALLNKRAASGWYVVCALGNDKLLLARIVEP